MENINIKITDEQQIIVSIDGTSGSLSQHYHSISDITNLQDELDLINNKANTYDNSIYVKYVAGDINGIGGHRAVYLDINKKLQYASSLELNQANKVIGITTNAGTFNEDIIVNTYGSITDVSFSFQIDLPIYLLYNGNITQTYPNDSAVCKVLGYAINTNTMLVDIQHTIII